jgi:pyruvate dehydrogenase E1 component beta subunit
LPLGVAAARRQGGDLSIVSLGVGVHRALEAADRLAAESGIDAEVIDLRCVQPLDRKAVTESVRKSGALLVVDEDYRDFGLSGELAATILEEGINARFARVCVEQTIPFDPRREVKALPNVDRIVTSAQQLISE